MKTKKHYILIFFLVFFSLVSNVYASRGELRYEITKFSLKDTKITFEGWAFIHQTNNYDTIYKLNYNNSTGYAYETKEVLLRNGEQKIKISAINKNTEKEIKSETVSGDSEKYYNFYKEMFYSFTGFGKKDNKRLVECYNGTSDTGCDNKCSDDNNQYTQCYYKDLHFSISFDVADWNIEDDTQVYFKIAAYNKDYGDWTEEEKLFLGKTAENSTLFNDYIEVDKKSFSNIIKFIANSAQLFNKYGTVEESGIYGDTRSNYKVEEIEAGKTNGNFITGSIDPGKYTLHIREKGICSYSDDDTCWLSTCRGFECDEGNKKLVAYGSWIKPTGTTSFTIKVKNDKKCAVSKQSTDSMNCNSWKNLSSTCEKLTIRNNNSSAVVRIEQNGYISNIFKSNLVNDNNEYNANSYDGGWFKYGIVYRNELSWSIVSGNNDNNITKVMQDKIKELGTFIDNLTMNIEGLNDLSGTQLIKKCTESGEFTAGNKLITVCTFFLPESYFENLNGQVSYSSDENLANINNKYYIPLNEKEHSIKVTLENLSRLKDKQAKTDSANKNTAWFGTWTIDTRCSLKVTNRLYEPSGGKTENGKVKYKFIYRPINLSNPFPNRFPGVNWYTWYITEGNKDRKTLEDSYKKLEYYTELDNRTISTIKEYNKNHNYFSKVDTDSFGDYIKEGGNS